MIIVTDNLIEPFDEGSKIATSKIIEHIYSRTKPFVISLNSPDHFPYVHNIFKTNNLLCNTSFYKALIKQKYNNILYIPNASATFFSIIRAKLLNVFTRKNVYILALQPRVYSKLEQLIVKIISPKLIITLSRKTSQYLSQMNIDNKYIHLAVDKDKYFAFDYSKKMELRNKHGIDSSKTVLLHVGHIQPSRNLDWFLELKKNNSDLEIVIVSSSYSQCEQGLYADLINEGVRIIDEYTPDMENIYNLADFYVFPVLSHAGAIETPLSVLEAMACNLPVITTRFGSLEDTFEADEDFFYVQSSAEIVDIINNRKKTECNNRKKMLPFTWERIADQLVKVIEDQ